MPAGDLDRVVVEELLAPGVVGHAAAVGLVRAFVLVLALLLERAKFAA